MIELIPNHCRIVRDSLDGQRQVDEQTFASVAILTERLELLKRRDSSFENISFSSAVKKLRNRKNIVAV